VNAKKIGEKEGKSARNQECIDWVYKEEKGRIRNIIKRVLKELELKI